MNWTDPKTNDLTTGFRELGFLPEAFLNMLAMLGWSDGTEQELFTLDELTEKFSLSKVHKGGAKFNFEKAKWVNHEWIKRLPVAHFKTQVQEIFKNNGLEVSDDEKFETILELVKDRCTLLTDFWQQASFFFKTPDHFDISSIQAKWNAEKTLFFDILREKLVVLNEWNASSIELLFKETAAEKNIKMGEVQLPFRLMLVGGKFGPGVFEIAALVGKQETINRIQSTLQLLQV